MIFYVHRCDCYNVSGMQLQALVHRAMRSSSYMSFFISVFIVLDFVGNLRYASPYRRRCAVSTVEVLCTIYV